MRAAVRAGRAVVRGLRCVPGLVGGGHGPGGRLPGARRAPGRSPAARGRGRGRRCQCCRRGRSSRRGVTGCRIPGWSRAFGRRVTRRRCVFRGRANRRAALRGRTLRRRAARRRYGLRRHPAVENRTLPYPAGRCRRVPAGRRGLRARAARRTSASRARTARGGARRRARTARRSSCAAGRRARAARGAGRRAAAPWGERAWARGGAARAGGVGVRAVRRGQRTFPAVLPAVRDVARGRARRAPARVVAAGAEPLAAGGATGR